MPCTPIIAFLLLLITAITNCGGKTSPIKVDKKYAEVSSNESAETLKDLDAGLNELSSKIIESMREGKKRKIAIMPFVDLNGKESDFGKFLADELIDLIFTTEKFGVIERMLLKNVMKEHSLAYTGAISPDSAKKIGEILGADAIATGTYTPLQKTVRIRARIIDVETAEIFAVAKTTIVLDKDINIMLGAEKTTPQVGRWDNETDSVKKDKYDKYISNALQKIKLASGKGLFNSYDIQEQNESYKAALVEIEMALHVYPDDEKAIKMKERIRKILGF